MKRAGALAWPAALLILTGCAGGAPLLHPAHVLKPYDVMAGAGLSGQLAVKTDAARTDQQKTLQDVAVAPGVAPWVSSRVGLPASNELGTTFTGHALRLDVRHAFDITSRAAISLGLGGSVLVGSQTPAGALGSNYSVAARFGGGGFDVPVLFGLHSASDLYSLWFGPRGGVDFLGTTTRDFFGNILQDVSGKHYYGGFVAGFRAGFRHVHIAVEVDVNYHHGDGSVTKGAAGKAPIVTAASIDQVSVTPAGALEITF